MGDRGISPKACTPLQAIEAEMKKAGQEWREGVNPEAVVAKAMQIYARPRDESLPAGMSAAGAAAFGMGRFTSRDDAGCYLIGHFSTIASNAVAGRILDAGWACVRPAEEDPR